MGDREIIARELADHNTGGSRSTSSTPPKSWRWTTRRSNRCCRKPDSSIHAGFELVKRGGASAFVSAGNSGAVMAAAMMILGNLAGRRPPGDRVAGADQQGFGAADRRRRQYRSQANQPDAVRRDGQRILASRAQCRPPAGRNSVQRRRSFQGHRPHPRRGRDAGADGDRINYVGYVEGRDINRAKVDVVVTDGFTGNVALKTMEGFASFMLGNLREVFGGRCAGSPTC